MINITLDNGFNLEFDEDIVNDMRFIDELADLQTSPTPVLIRNVSDQIIGKEKKEELYKILENEEGRVPQEAFVEALDEIITKAAEQRETVKN